MSIDAFYRTVMGATGAGDREAAQRITGAVLRALRDRLTVEEATQAAAQLPQELRQMWSAGEVASGRPVRMNREAFCARVMRDAELASPEGAERAVRGVFAALRAQLSPGEAGDILAQLPKDLKPLWDEARPAAPAPAAPTVRDVMTPNPFTLDPEAPVGTALAVMTERGIRHLPVVDDAGRLRGMVTDRDLRCAALAPAFSEHLSAAARRRLRSAGTALENLRVRDVMTWDAVTIGPDAPLAQAAAIMVEGRFSGLPVVAEGRLVGIVTERDALRALAQTLPAVKGVDPDTFLW
jgi:CBS domain-containing protein